MIYTAHGRLYEPMSSACAVNVMGRDTIQDRVAVVQSAAYDRAGYDVSYLPCDERTDMAERSHVKTAGAHYSRNMILERQLTVQCHAENPELVHER